MSNDLFTEMAIFSHYVGTRYPLKQHIVDIV